MDTTIADEPAIATSTPSTWRERITGRLADATRLVNWTRPTRLVNWPPEGTASPSASDEPRSPSASDEPQPPSASDEPQPPSASDEPQPASASEDGNGGEDGDPGLPVVADGAGEPTVTDPQHPAQGGPTPRETLDLDRWWVLVAPLVGGVVLSSVSLAFDPNPLRTGTSPSGLFAFAVLVPFFILCVAGTLALFRDAARLQAVGADWSPNPWHYVVPSALLLVALHVYLVVRTTGRIDDPLGFLVGSLVVALATSSILAGPAYLFRRRRRLEAE